MLYLGHFVLKIKIMNSECLLIALFFIFDCLGGIFGLF